jgi:hypothetical protein
MGRMGTREDLTVHQQYMADLVADVKAVLDVSDPSPYFQKYGNNTCAAIKVYLDAMSEVVAAPVIEKYTGVLAAADVFSAATALRVMNSVRLDLGYASRVHL